MKYSEAKQTNPELSNTNNLWAKKFSEIHIGAKNETKCGITMLGNNYAPQAVIEDRHVCHDCLHPHEENIDRIISNQ
jgi:hypothetical protein